MIAPDANEERRKDYFLQDIHIKYGEECCSQYSISFHYINKQLMRDIHDYLYHCSKEVKKYYYDTMGYDYFDGNVMTFSSKSTEDTH